MKRGKSRHYSFVNQVEIEIDYSLKTKLERQREKLFDYYRKICGFQEIRNLETWEISRVSTEEAKKRRGYKPLSSILPKQIIVFKHELPLKILAFSDYRVHDFKPLLDYVKKLKEKPDLIVYAGDDVERFGPVPRSYIILPSSKAEICPFIECVRLKKEGGYISSPSFGFILRLPKAFKKVNLIVKRIQLIWDFLHLIIQAFEENKLKSIESLKNMIQSFPIQIELRIFKRKLIKEEKLVSLIETSTKMELYRMVIDEHEKLQPEILSDYNVFYKMYKNIRFDQLKLSRIGSDKRYLYYHIPAPNHQTSNIFEELAQHSRYGLVAVIGNDDDSVARTWIRGHNVYDLHDSWLKIGRLLIIGLEGSTCGLGPSGNWLESDIKLILDFARKRIKENEWIIIVSHTPPRGILDRAMRFGDESVGSFALRDFLEECEKVSLVICGHVHRCGGKCEKLNETAIVNVSSHDDVFSKANVAWISICGKNKHNIEFTRLPSLFEVTFKKNIDKQNLNETLQRQIGLSLHESELFIRMHKKRKEKFFDDLPELASLKFRYGFSWKNVFDFYENGILRADQITEEIYERLLDQTKGIHKLHLKRGYVNIKRIKENKAYLLHQIPFVNSKIIAFDTEYSEKGALYGFLDLSTNEFKQFWFNEIERAQDFLRKRQNYLFVHWGGADKKLLREELKCNAPTLNLLYFVQTSLVAPIDSSSLENVHDVLCGHKNDEWWEKSFYCIPGILKACLCNRIFMNPNDKEAKEKLKDANKADVLALKEVIEKLKILDENARSFSTN